MGADNTFGETNFNPKKKYFAKYLPVEGKITDPEMVMFKIDGKWTEPCEFESFVGNEIEEVKQGKLFLCSRDIQVGDMCYKGNDYSLAASIIPKHKEALEYLMKEDYHKVIGQISPNAQWVKEGDEFDEEELCCYLRAGFNSGSQDHELPFTERDPSRLYYGIKGPCGHFH